MIYSGMEPERVVNTEVEVLEVVSFEMAMKHAKENYLDPQFDTGTDKYIFFDFDGTLVRDSIAKGSRFPVWSKLNKLVPSINEDTIDHLKEVLEMTEGRVAIVTNRNRFVRTPWNSDQIMQQLQSSLSMNELDDIVVFENMNRAVQFRVPLLGEVADVIGGNRKRYQNLAGWIKELRTDNPKVRIVMVSDSDLGLSVTERPFLRRIARDFNMIEPMTQMDLVHIKLA